MSAVVGVVGAGTMGIGIAQLAAQSGARTLLFDVSADAVGRGLERLDALVERRKVARAVRERVEGLDALAGLDGAEAVIEAVAERLDVKRELLAALEGIVAPDTLLASNTSSLSVPAMATGLEHPERVVGMPFFNPPPLMELVEVVAGD